MRSPERREGSSLTLSFRTRILFIELALGTIPPLLLGLWLTRSGTRTSQALVVSQVEEVLQDDALSELFQTRIGSVLADGERFFRVRTPA